MAEVMFLHSFKYSDEIECIIFEINLRKKSLIFRFRHNLMEKVPFKPFYFRKLTQLLGNLSIDLLAKFITNRAAIN